jgi:hypothetical protein
MDTDQHKGEKRMKAESCDYEEQVVQAAIAGIWPPDLIAHRRSCPVCDESAFLVKQLAENEPANIPAPGIIWWKHQLRLKRLHSDDSLKPILLWERIGFPIAIILLLGLAALILTAQLQRIPMSLTVSTLGFGTLLVPISLATLIGLLRDGHRK